MDPFELLKADHRKVSELFESIESSPAGAKRQLFNQLKNELDVHAKVEETVFYPALENKQESRDITLEAYEEHKVVKDLLAELEAAKDTDDEWDAKLKVLKENVEHHVEEEEGQLFDKAEDVLSDAQLENLGVQMETAKVRMVGKEATSSDRKSEPKEESPGVLKRLARLVGLGKPSKSKKAKKTAPAAKSKGKGKSVASKAKKKAAKKAAKSGAKKRTATKAKQGRATKRSKAAKTAGGARGARKRVAKKRNR